MSAMTEHEVIEVDGCPIAWSARGDRDQPALVLVHGAGANSHWWDRTLEYLPHDQRLVALDLSGHGQSGHRSTYEPEVWTREIEAVTAAATRGTAAIVGHSSGGRISVVAAGHPASAVESLVLIDAPVRRPGLPPFSGSLRIRPRRLYHSREEVIAAFRLLPPQPVTDRATLGDLASKSIVEQAGGWSFSSDPGILGVLSDAEVATALASVSCPVAVIRGALSTLVDNDSVAFVRETLGYAVPAIDIPDAYHHPMLDAPLATAEAILTLLIEAPLRAAQ
jgi:pimeloyl-ACP methyl ester carboxylesterase